MLPSNCGRPLDAPVRRRASAVTTNSSVSARLTSRERMSTSGLRTSVTPPPSLCVSTSGSADAPGQAGSERSTRRGRRRRRRATAAGSVTRQRVARRARATCAAAGRSASRSRAAARKPAATRASVSPMRWRSAPSAATNTNSTAPGHERLAAGLGVEGERVGGQHDERRCRSRRAATSRRRTRPARRRPGTGRARAPRSAQAMFHVSRVGKMAANVSG